MNVEISKAHNGMFIEGPFRIEMWKNTTFEIVQVHFDYPNCTRSKQMDMRRS